MEFNHKVEEIYVIVAVRPDGEEGVLEYDEGGPMIFSKPELLERSWQEVLEVCERENCTPKVIKFTQRQEITDQMG